LMFGVGLHFSLKDLLAVRAIAVPGALAQGLVATPLGMAVGWSLGWSAGAGLIFGVALSVASTVVLLRVLQERRLIETERGRITVGWLIVQDIAMVLVLVLLPGLTALFHGMETAPGAVEIVRSITILLGKFAIFIAVMLLFGKKLIPAILHYVAHTGSRELFRLAVLSIALGVAYAAAELFGISLALGAFFAGMMLSESQLSQQAATESLPLRDAFAVLFFVSVGMLFDRAVLLAAPLALLATIVIILIGKSVVAFFVVRLFGHARSTALMISASLAQIGEFSFILADLGINLGLLSERGRDLILGTSIITILANPFLVSLATRIHPAHPPGEPVEEDAPPELHPTALSHHVVLVGYGRVGGLIGRALKERHETFLVVEDADRLVANLREQKIEVIPGNAVEPRVLEAANVKGARRLLIAIPNGFEAGQIVQQSRALNPQLHIVARAHSNDEVDYLLRLSADAVIMGEREIARGMIEQSFGAEDTASQMAAPALADRVSSV